MITADALYVECISDTTIELFSTPKMALKARIIHYLLDAFTKLIILFLLFFVLWTTTGAAFSPPNGTLFWLLMLFIAAIVGGEISRCMNAPSLLGMLISGFVLTNFTPMTLNVEVSSGLRNIAFTVILLRAGFGLDPNDLKKLSGVCFRLACLSSVAEAVAIAISTHLILSLSLSWGFLLGFVVSSSSPAVIVPGLLSLSERGFGNDKGIPTLAIAVSSFNDVFAITGYGVFLNIVFIENSSLVWQLCKGPLEAFVGVTIGIAIGLILWVIPQDCKNENKNANNQRIALSILFGLAVVFTSLYIDWGGVGPLATLTLSFIAAFQWRRNGIDIQVEKGVKLIWILCQPFLFSLIGAEVQLSTIKTDKIILCFVCLLIGLIIRCISTVLFSWGAEFNVKEKLFIAISGLPKATVQAAVGSVALEMARKANDEQNIENATIVLNIAVISILVTAPLGALLVAVTGPRLLNQENVAQFDTSNVINEIKQLHI